MFEPNGPRKGRIAHDPKELQHPTTALSFLQAWAPTRLWAYGSANFHMLNRCLFVQHARDWWFWRFIVSCDDGWCAIWTNPWLQMARMRRRCFFPSLIEGVDVLSISCPHSPCACFQCDWLFALFWRIEIKYFWQLATPIEPLQHVSLCVACDFLRWIALDECPWQTLILSLLDRSHCDEFVLKYAFVHEVLATDFEHSQAHVPYGDGIWRLLVLTVCHCEIISSAHWMHFFAHCKWTYLGWRLGAIPPVPALQAFPSGSQQHWQRWCHLGRGLSEKLCDAFWRFSNRLVLWGDPDEAGGEANPHLQVPSVDPDKALVLLVVGVFWVWRSASNRSMLWAWADLCHRISAMIGCQKGTHDARPPREGVQEAAKPSWESSAAQIVNPSGAHRPNPGPRTLNPRP